MAEAKINQFHFHHLPLLKEEKLKHFTVNITHQEKNKHNAKYYNNITVCILHCVARD